MPEIRIEAIAPDDAPLLDAAFALYRDSIERSEQRPEPVFRALIHRPDYRFLAAKLDDDLIGVAVSWVPDNASFWLFEYAAVTERLRGNNIGANLFFASRLMAGQERTALIEVDAFTGEELQAKRLAFYRRIGCRRLAGLDYILPLDAFGTPPPMWLLAFTSPDDQPAVSVFQVEAWLRAIYAHVYGKSLDDPRLAAMIDPLPDDVELAGI
jgi:hypothetical protein